MTRVKPLLTTVTDYIATATPDQIKADMEAADFDAYRGVGDPVINSASLMNNTPITDAAYYVVRNPDGSEYNVVKVDVARGLERENARLRAALEDIHTTAHCIAKAGPLSTPTLQDARGKFDNIAAMATAALTRHGE